MGNENKNEPDGESKKRKQIVVYDERIPEPTLAESIGRVVREGKVVEFIPKTSPYGIVYMQVKVRPMKGKPGSTVCRNFHILFDTKELAGFIRRACVLSNILPGLEPPQHPADPPPLPG